MKNLIFLLILSFALLFITAPTVYARTQTSGDLEVTYETPLFSSTIIWYPGLSHTKSFTVKNLGSSLQTVSLASSNTSQTGDVAGVFLVKIREGATPRYGGSDDKTMKNFWNAGQFNLSDLSGGGSTTYDMTITMGSSAGNSYQGKEAKFDLNIGFWGTTSQVTVSGGTAGGAGIVAKTAATISSGLAVASAAGFIPGILGVTTEATARASPSSQILDTELSPSPTLPLKNQVSLFANLRNFKNVLWLILLIILIVAAYFIWKKKH